MRVGLWRGRTFVGAALVFTSVMAVLSMAPASAAGVVHQGGRGGSVWTRGLVDDDDADSAASIAFSHRGVPTLAWVHENTDDIVVARWLGALWSKVAVPVGGPARCFGRGVSPILDFNPRTGEPTIVTWCSTVDVHPQPIYLTTERHGIWTTTRITTTPDSGTIPCVPGVTGISLAFDPQTGDPEVAYGDRAGHDLHWVHRSGAAWLDDVIFDYDDCTPDGPAPSLAANPLTGRIGLAWSANFGGQLFYAEYDGAWSKPTRIRVNHLLGGALLRYDPSGTAWILSQQLEPQTGDEHIIVARQDSGAWSVSRVGRYPRSSSFAADLVFQGETPVIGYTKDVEPFGVLSTRLLRFDGAAWVDEPIARRRNPALNALAVASGGQLFAVYRERDRGDLRWARS
jgi:hypothetical protein